MKRRILDMVMAACCMAVSFLGLAACDNELDIQQEYPFTVESMPVADEIAGDETVEIRLEIKPEGNFSGTTIPRRATRRRRPLTSILRTTGETCNS